LEFARKVQVGEVSSEEMGFVPSEIFEREKMEEYLRQCSNNYIRIGNDNPRRFLQQRQLFDNVSGTEGTAVYIDKVISENNNSTEGAEEGIDHYWIDVAVSNSLPQIALKHLCQLLHLHNFDITKARLDIVKDGDNGSTTILRMLVSSTNASDDDDRTLLFDELRREILRMKWLDPSTMNLVFRYHHLDLGVTQSEVITAISSLIHPILAKENALAYSKATILETITSERLIPYATSVADLFLDRFRPENPLSDKEYDARCKSLRETVENDLAEDRIASKLLLQMMSVVDCTLKTNVYMEKRYALALRLDPSVMLGAKEGQEDRPLPYGILFVHGRRFNSYQIRFRDISRGGLRLVTPRSSELYALESARQYEECYGLAYAQQLKNKDIPEGGSKAVCLIDTVGMSDSSKGFVMRKSVKAFTDCMLDLIVDTEETRRNIVDLYGKKEVLYLGPDEQVIADDINWIIKNAEYRGYRTPAAFMSSKPRAGINHKEFGVTSEGVNVYLDVALQRVLGIDPRASPFTVKITGGPDGDVAGNELKILMREYGENAKIVGIADASGCAEDPNGLDHGELDRLVAAELSIDQFDTSKLSNDGILHTINTVEGTKARNSMHNRLKADAFLPCGGRPNTMDVSNYQHFFLGEDDTGRKIPSSRLIVEGANLFISNEARQKLFEEAGVKIVKDSSANKGGVITSSYEICAAMLLDNEEEKFFENKEQIVGEVLGKIRELAKMEGELLFREFENVGDGSSLPEVSEIISDSINIATDVLSEALDDEHLEVDIDSLLPLFRAHLPKTLADLSFHHVHERVPAQYIKNAISSCLASKLVYKEGTKFISVQNPKKLAQIALKYIQKEKEIAILLESIENSTDLQPEDKQQITELLRAGGARTALQVF